MPKPSNPAPEPEKLPAYTLLRSRRRTLAIEITRRGEVLVRAPLTCPRAEIERFLLLKADWITRSLALQQQRQAAHPEPDEAQQAELRRRAKAELPLKAAHYAALMGVAPTHITITSARTRFGSCSASDRLSFSWRLMQYPDAAVDCVVVHELAHIRHKNHGPEFYALVTQILPDYYERAALLRQ